MNFKDPLKRNDYNTLSIIIFSMHTLIFYCIFMRDRERGEERRERREKREGERRREKGERERREKRERDEERREREEGEKR